MRIFVSEYLCSGAWREPELPPSLAREGRAMLLALLTDLAALPEVTLSTTWDARLGDFPLEAHRLPSVGLVECIVIGDAADEAAMFQRLASECDATYVIAPELDDLLTQRVQRVLDAGGRSLNASPAAIAVCSDKWATYQCLSAASIPTVPTALFDPASSSPPFDFPLVLKPRYGAGSQNTYLIRDASELSRQRSAVSDQQNPKSKIQNPKSIIQPHIPGRTLSVAAVFRSDGTLREVWPVGEQVLSDDGRFTYLGGRLPAEIIEGAVVTDLIIQFSNRISGLRGYIGFDLILPDDGARPLVVDINPRLTTSYLGYRALASGNLAARILWPDRDWPPVDWRAERIEFLVDGTLARSPAGRG